jgi:hypothetical protein
MPISRVWIFAAYPKQRDGGKSLAGHAATNATRNQASKPASQRGRRAGRVGGVAIPPFQKEAKDGAPRLVGAKTPLICEENWRAGRLRAEKWGEKTADLSGDLGRKNIVGAKAPLMSEEISGIRRLDAWETRSELHIEAKVAAK